MYAVGVAPTASTLTTAPPSLTVPLLLYAQHSHPQALPQLALPPIILPPQPAAPQLTPPTIYFM